MNYPVWQLDGLGGGLLVALIAIVHVYVSHFAVGGGLFLVLTEGKALRESNHALLEFVKKHTRFFLLLTMVFGGLTGVGIWFIIALTNPAATSVLIHTFVFGWAMEWVFFVIEIVSLFIYYYTFDRMRPCDHLLIGWIYFGAAWMSLFIINGIIDFMLTPGEWLNNRDFWSGFFNPTFWPALSFRTFLALLIAGLFGMLTATFMKDTALRSSLLRYSGMWLIGPLVLLVASAWWYKAALPPDLSLLIFRGMPHLQPIFSGFATVSALLVLGGLLLAIRMPQVVSRPVAFVMLSLGLIHIGAFEFVREGGRRPYIIHNHMYSTSIFRKDLATTQKQGLLSQAKWVKERTISEDNQLAAGRELFNMLCLPCHSLGGPLHDIIDLTKNYTPAGMEAYLRAMGVHNPYMPPFAGNDAERAALAHFISYGIHGKKGDTQARGPVQSIQPAAFNPDQDTHLLLGWVDGGGLCLEEGKAIFSLGPPPRRLQAQLLLRGETPQVLAEGFTLSLRTGEVAEGMPLQADPQTGVFEVLLPEDLGAVQHLDLEARDEQNKILARTLVSLPATRYMGCYNCHGGELGGAGGPAFTEATAMNILAAHDKLSHTDLQARFRQNGRINCQECHSDRAVAGGAGQGLLNLSAAMHGFHAVYFRDRGGESCATCHGGNPENTGCQGDIHQQVSIGCTNCHGTMEEHSASLLKGNSGKRAKHLLTLLGQDSPAVTNAVARSPWSNQPDCLTCHQDFAPPENDSAVNTWTLGDAQRYSNRSDNSETLRCSACHGAIHHLYPVAKGARVAANSQPLQYQKNALPIGSENNCAVCHTTEMSDSVHHPNMERPFRNKP